MDKEKEGQLILKTQEILRYLESINDNTVPGHEYDNESLGSLPAFAEDKDGLIYEYLQ